jgi:pSer/pThr/pTyr-binding forkhead associated (FHA) protein
MSGLCLVNLCAENRTKALESTVVINALPCIVGRDPECDRLIDDPAASRRHCAFTLRHGRVWVEDLGSRNGTFLNGTRLEGARPVTAGDRLDLGRLPFRVCFPTGTSGGGSGDAFSMYRPR